MTVRTLVIREIKKDTAGEMLWSTEKMIASGWKLIASEHIYGEETNSIFRKDAEDEEPFLPLQSDL